MTGSRLILLLLMMMTAGSPALADDAPPVSGAARARAAETVVIGAVRIRFAGVLAPAPGRTCGREAETDCAVLAVKSLSTLLEKQDLRCTRTRRLGHGVYEGTCQLPDGTDPAVPLLESGLLIPADGAPANYGAAADAARANGRGVWRL